jgi:hypothetical protein
MLASRTPLTPWLQILFSELGLSGKGIDIILFPMSRNSFPVLKMAAAWLGGIALALPLESCDRNDHRAPASQRADHQPSPASQRDEAVLARRGFGRAELSFGPPEPFGPGAETSAGLGPFRLGMTIDAVRSAARKAHVQSTGQFAGNGVRDLAWCAPAVEAAGGALILAPKELSFNACRSSGSCDFYQLGLGPVDSRLRLVSIYVSEARQVKAGGELLQRLGSNGASRLFTPCELTSSEMRRLEGWDHLEASGLIDTLGYPNLDRDRLPAAVRATLDRWEKSVTIAPDGSDDAYALSPIFDGNWQSGGNFVIEYTLGIAGFGPHSIPYLIVVGPGGNLVWNGAAEEFERHGLNGRQQTPLESDNDSP